MSKDKEKSKGVGDTLANVIKGLKLDRLVKKTDGSSDCEPCKKRQEALNNMFPYKKESK